jgi:pimeloyl-[acyl-carrier protein] methyl ester esterase
MKPLYSTSMGQGEALLMLHGWAMNSQVMADFARKLASDFKVISVDLPGHGRSPDQGSWTLDSVVDQLAAMIHKPVICLGWSLGGLLALRLAACYPDKVSRVILMAASPRFVQADDWPDAQDDAVFERFSNELQKDVKSTLLRFLLLQAHGLQQLKQTVNQLKQGLDEGGVARFSGLESGLAALHKEDLRADLQQLHCPVHMLLGDRDRLIPASVLAQAQRLMPNLTGQVLQGAAHQTFISLPELCRQAVVDFCLAASHAA